MDEYGRDGRLGLLAFAGGGMAFAISLVNVIGLMIGKQPPAGLYDLALLLFSLPLIAAGLSLIARDLQARSATWKSLFIRQPGSGRPGSAMLAFALFEGLFAGMLVYVRALVGSSARADWQTWLPVVICCVVLVLCGAVVLTGKDRRPVPAVPVRPVDWVVVLLAFTTTGMLFYAMTDGPERFRAWSGPALLLGLITLMFGLVVAVARIRSRA